jgi:hypothetical protein
LMWILPEHTFFVFFVDFLILGDFCLQSCRFCVVYCSASLFRDARYRRDPRHMFRFFSVVTLCFCRQNVGWECVHKWVAPKICGPDNTDCQIWQKNSWLYLKLIYNRLYLKLIYSRL